MSADHLIRSAYMVASQALHTEIPLGGELVNSTEKINRLALVVAEALHGAGLLADGEVPRKAEKPMTTVLVHLNLSLPVDPSDRADVLDAVDLWLASATYEDLADRVALVDPQ
jgi:hypothetical protein